MADFLPAICKIHQYCLYLHKQNGGLSNQLCFSRVYQRVLSLKLTRLNRLLTPLPSSNHPFFRKKQLAVLGRFTLNVMATAALTQKDSFKNTAHPSRLSSTTRSFFFVFLIPRYQLIWEKFSTIFQYQLLQGTVVAQSGTVGQDAEFIPFAWKAWKKEVKKKGAPWICHFRSIL